MTEPCDELLLEQVLPQLWAAGATEVSLPFLLPPPVPLELVLGSEFLFTLHENPSVGGFYKGTWLDAGV